MSATRHWAEHLRLSHHGAAFIAREEGVRLAPYVDTEGWATTGVGHLIQPQHRGVTSEDRRRWTFPSAAAAIAFFRDHDVIVYERAVRSTLGRASVVQVEYDMCVSLCFNIGTGGFHGSSVARAIVAGHHRAAADAFLNWAHPSVLLGRRQRERAHFLAGHW